MQIVLIFHLFDLQYVISFEVEEENVEGGEDIYIYFIFFSLSFRMRIDRRRSTSHRCLSLHFLVILYYSN